MPFTVSQIPTFFAACLVSAGVVLLLTPAVRRLANQRKWFDSSEAGVKRRDRDIPRLGGVAIGIGLAFGALVLVLVGADPTSDLWPLFAGAFVLWIVGIVDDVYGVGFKRKFVMQSLVAYALVLSGWKLDLTPIPFLGALTGYEQAVIAIPAVMLWLVGVMNAINITDGQDGLAAGLSMMAFLALAAIAGSQNQWQLVAFCVMASATLGAFLVYNWTPASIFMGDSGSLLLGFLLAALSLRIADVSATAWGILAPAVVLGLPLLDTISSMVRRLLAGNSPFAADTDHIHHRMVHAAGSTRTGVLILYTFGLAFGALGIAVARSPWPWPVAAIVVALVLSVVLLRQLSYFRIHQVVESIQRRWKERRPADMQTPSGVALARKSAAQFAEEKAKRRSGSTREIEEETWTGEDSRVSKSPPASES